MADRYGIRLGSGGRACDSSVGPINYERMRKERLEKAQAALKRNGIAAALLFRSENIRYVMSTIYTDFLDRLRYSVLFAEHEPLLFEAPGKYALGDAPWVKPEQVKLSLQWACQSPGKEASKESAKQFAASIKSELEKKGLAREPLGVDDIDEVGRQALLDVGLKLINAMPVMLEARAVKTRDEINCIHMVTNLCDAAHYAMYEALKPGVRERDIRAIGFDSLLRNGAEMVWDVLVSAGGFVGGMSMNTERIIQPGDVVTIDIVRATYMGYTSCYYRNYKVGTRPTAREKDLHKRSYDRMYKVIDAIRPGITTAEVAENWATAEEKGLPDDRLMWCDDLAHGLGLWLYEYPICNRLWSPKHPMVIEEGMTMAVEAMEFDPLVGRTKLEEMLAVTKNGVEIFSRMPVEEMMIANPITLA